MTNLKQEQNTMWIYAKNTDKDKTNMDMSIHTSKNNNVPEATIKIVKKSGGAFQQ
jgi:hypothetical protein